MLVIPAIDLHGGQCVRIRQSRYAVETDYFADPVAMAKLWRVMNAKVLHLIDLDAAGWVKPQQPDNDTPHDNHGPVASIAQALDIPVQVGGGIQTPEAIEATLALGVYRVVFGPVTEATAEAAGDAVARFGARRVIVAIDAQHTGVTDPPALAADLEARGVRRIVYTDVDRSGERTRPNIEAIRALADRLTLAKVTVAGGVTGYPDLLALQTIERSGVDSVVVGRALYENTFPCQRFWCWQKPQDVDLSRFSTARLALRSDG